MRFAYADPPYPGKSRKYYRDHPHFDGEVDHVALIARLEKEFPDGWALSTDMASLGYILPLCPPPEPRGAAGLQPGDELVDLFPGSGAVAAEWASWSAQLQLARAASPTL